MMDNEPCEACEFLSHDLRKPLLCHHHFMQKLDIGSGEATAMTMIASGLEQLSPASRAAYEELCRGVLEVALAGERVHPGDGFLKAHRQDHFLHAMNHLAASRFATHGGQRESLDADTNLQDIWHAAWRIALMAAVQKK